FRSGYDHEPSRPTARRPEERAVTAPEESGDTVDRQARVGQCDRGFNLPSRQARNVLDAGTQLASWRLRGDRQPDRLSRCAARVPRRPGTRASANRHQMRGTDLKVAALVIRDAEGDRSE